MPPTHAFKGKRCCKKSKTTTHTIAPQLESETKVDGGRVLVCVDCGMEITTSGFAVERDGSHHHVFFNPHGHVFEIGCFASAHNLTIHGTPTDEDTWFSGYTWQIATCSGCNNHLGWKYCGSQDAFFGLIPGMLKEADKEE